MIIPQKETATAATNRIKTVLKASLGKSLLEAHTKSENETWAKKGRQLLLSKNGAEKTEQLPR